KNGQQQGGEPILALDGRCGAADYVCVAHSIFPDGCWLTVEPTQLRSVRLHPSTGKSDVKSYLLPLARRSWPEHRSRFRMLSFRSVADLRGNAGTNPVVA